MHVSDHGGPLRTPDSGEQRVTPLELFFDLVCLRCDPALPPAAGPFEHQRSFGDAVPVTGGVVGRVYTAWFTNWFDPDRLPVAWCW